MKARPDIRLESLLDGANRAEGIVAVIDVYRAFTTAAVAFACGAEKVLMVGDVNEALALRQKGLGAYCIGEVNGVPPEGFDYGNSPCAIERADVAGKGLIQRTSAGTQGIVAAIARAERLYAAALVTAKATAKAMKFHINTPKTIVAMGKRGLKRSMEDEICGLYMKCLLEGGEGDAAAARAMIYNSPESAKFKDPNYRQFAPQDMEIALSVNRFDFAVRVKMEDGIPTARKEKVE